MASSLFAEFSSDLSTSGSCSSTLSGSSVSSESAELRLPRWLRGTYRYLPDLGPVYDGVDVELDVTRVG